jgi:hypothetical protein
MDLHQHHIKENHTSSYHFITLEDGTHMVDEIGSMWYHFGKSFDQLTAIERINGGKIPYKKNKEMEQRAFYLHTRIQIYISFTEVRLWLVLATDKNYYDRKIFKERLVREKGYKDAIWEAIKNIMDKGYFYEIDGEKLPLVSTLVRENFFKFVLKDKDGVYSGIAKDYAPDDPKIARDVIEDEMWAGIQNLYPLYNLMAYRLTPSPKPLQAPSSNYAGLFGGVGKVKVIK